MVGSINYLDLLKRPNQSMNITFFSVHPNFSIQGRSFNEKELGIYATSLLLSEKPYQEQLGTFLLEWLGECDEIRVYTSGSTGTQNL